MMMNEPEHPGTVLRDRIAGRITQSELARYVGSDFKVIHRIIHGKSRITVRMAHRLGAAIGPSPFYWLELQAKHDASCNVAQGIDRHPAFPMTRKKKMADSYAKQAARLFHNNIVDMTEGGGDLFDDLPVGTQEALIKAVENTTKALAGKTDAEAVISEMTELYNALDGKIVAARGVAQTAPAGHQDVQDLLASAREILTELQTLAENKVCELGARAAIAEKNVVNMTNASIQALAAVNG